MVEPYSRVGYRPNGGYAGGRRRATDRPPSPRPVEPAPALTATPRPVELGGASTRGGAPGVLVSPEPRLLVGAVGGGRAVELAGGRAGRPLLRDHLGADLGQDATQRAEGVPGVRQGLCARG